MKNIVKSIIAIKKFIKSQKSDCNDNFIEALKDAVEAMKKQMPKKPIRDEEYFSCPCCKYEFPDIGGVWESCGESEKYNFCPYCGQRIDYGD